MIRKIIKRILPKKILKTIENIRLLNQLKKTKKIKEYVKRYLPQEEGIQETKQFIPYQKLPIWQLWLQGEDNAPNIVKNCLKSVKYYNPDREVVLLTEENISDYISLPPFIVEKYKKGIISNTHYSDIVRVFLLSKYGGTWIDATILFTGDIPKKILESDFFCFSSTEDSLYYDYHLISSWFIHSQPEHVFMKIMQETLFLYWERENELLDYFLLHILFKNMIDENKFMKSQWDSLYHLSNIEPHLLSKLLNEIYSDIKFDKIKHITSVHKLTYKQNRIIAGSFFDKLSK